VSCNAGMPLADLGHAGVEWYYWLVTPCLL